MLASTFERWSGSLESNRSSLFWVNRSAGTESNFWRFLAQEFLTLTRGRTTFLPGSRKSQARLFLSVDRVCRLSVLISA